MEVLLTYAVSRNCFNVARLVAISLRASPHDEWDKELAAPERAGLCQRTPAGIRAAFPGGNLATDGGVFRCVCSVE
jgi:hypothetical protein